MSPSSYGAAGSSAPPAEVRGNGSGALAKTASHHARRLAERFALDISGVKGTGPDGLILREDVETAMTAGTLKPASSNGNGKANGAAAVTYPPGQRGDEGRRDQGLRGDARELHGSEHVDSHGDVVPYDFRRHARTAARGTQRRPQNGRTQRKDLVHAFDRVRNRSGRQRAARHVCSVPPRQRQTAARRGGHQPRPRRRFAAQRRFAHARRARDQGRRHARFRCVPRGPTKISSPRRATTSSRSKNRPAPRSR